MCETGRPQKNEDDKLSSFLHIRVRRDDKAFWVKEAQKEGLNLSKWVVQKLGAGRKHGK